jgi:hypothetical protein
VPQQRTWRGRYARWRARPVVQNVMAALAVGAGFLAWSPLASDSLEVVLALSLIFCLAALGLYDERRSRPRDASSSGDDLKEE